jgi:hypothetical protein
VADEGHLNLDSETLEDKLSADPKISGKGQTAYFFPLAGKPAAIPFKLGCEALALGGATFLGLPLGSFITLLLLVVVGVVCGRP